jgi:UDP-2-acetamido-2-deoxy-ribo-hexuluronate aminotransferase
MKNIPFNKFQSFYLNYGADIQALAHEVFSSGKYIRAKHTRMLEESIQHITGRTYAITTASCTDALFFALKAAGVQPGDEVILPAFSYIASLSPVLMCGATPVFVDIHLEDFMLDEAAIMQAVSNKTKAIIFVQLFGNLRNIEALHEWAKERNMVLIEDAAQALGAENGTARGGGSGDISCISFDPTKIVSAFGTGGMVCTDNAAYFDTISKLIHHGRNPNGEFEMLGYNSKIPELNAALIHLQLKYLDETMEVTNAIAEKYFSLLQGIKEIEFCEIHENAKSTFHKFVIRAKSRDELRDYLFKNGVETRIHYNPLLHEHKLLRNIPYLGRELPVSNQMKKSVLSLPMYCGLEPDEIEYICEIIRKFYDN